MSRLHKTASSALGILRAFGSEPCCLGGVGDLHYGSRSERVPRPACLGSLQIELPDGCDSIASQYHQRKIFGQRGRKTMVAIPAALRYRGKSDSAWLADREHRCGSDPAPKLQTHRAKAHRADKPCRL